MNTPIFLVGLPRTGTTWIASVLGATAGTAYFHEPFNYRTVKESAPFEMRYRRATENDPEFDAYCRKCFAGRQRHRAVMRFQAKWRRWLPRPLGRVLIKDVHTILSLDWIDRHVRPRIVIVLRHPMGMADSWGRLGYGNNDNILKWLTQPSLLEDYLGPFESHIRSADDFWSRMGTHWAACYHVVFQQQRKHPEWIVVRHEDFIEDPAARFRELCGRLDLTWTPASERRLVESNAEDSGKRYVPRRILAKEREKWRMNLTPEQMQAVARGVAPFDVPAYSL